LKHVTALVMENFQSHVRSEFRFGPGLNVIVGPSDSGKSAAVRALRWVLYNEPRGVDHVRLGSASCRVQVTFSDGVEIVRELYRTKAVARHRYIVRQPGEQEKTFEGFGTDVPPDVTRAHGMPQIYLDKDRDVTLNLGSQLEGPFLLADTGTNRARAIGRILGVHVVDAAIRGSVRDLREMNRRRGDLEKEVERLDGELAPFADLPAQEEALRKAGDALTGAEASTRRLERLERLRDDLAEREAAGVAIGAALRSLAGLPQAEAAVAKAETAAVRAREAGRIATALNRNREETGRVRAMLDAAVAVAVAEERMAALEEQGIRLRRLSDVAHRYRSATEGLSQAGQVLGRLAGLSRAEEAAAAAEAKQQRAERLHSLKTSLENCDGSLQKGSAALSEVGQSLQGMLQQYGELLVAIGRCPTCGSPLGREHLAQILEELAGGLEH
jgi:DNA repair protein SbcC/Rad50